MERDIWTLANENRSKVKGTHFVALKLLGFYSKKIESNLSIMEVCKTPWFSIPKKKTFFNAGIVEQSVRFDTHGNSDAGNQLKDFLNGISGE